MPMSVTVPERSRRGAVERQLHGCSFLDVRPRRPRSACGVDLPGREVGDADGHQRGAPVPTFTGTSVTVPAKGALYSSGQGGTGLIRARFGCGELGRRAVRLRLRHFELRPGGQDVRVWPRRSASRRNRSGGRSWWPGLFRAAWAASTPALVCATLAWAAVTCASATATVDRVWVSSSCANTCPAVTASPAATESAVTRPAAGNDNSARFTGSAVRRPPRYWSAPRRDGRGSRLRLARRAKCSPPSTTTTRSTTIPAMMRARFTVGILSVGSFVGEGLAHRHTRRRGGRREGRDGDTTRMTTSHTATPVHENAYCSGRLRNASPILRLMNTRWDGQHDTGQAKP